jgi:hypothetical protein
MAAVVVAVVDPSSLSGNAKGGKEMLPRWHAGAKISLLPSLPYFS